LSSQAAEVFSVLKSIDWLRRLWWMNLSWFPVHKLVIATYSATALLVPQSVQTPQAPPDHFVAAHTEQVISIKICQAHMTRSA